MIIHILSEFDSQIPKSNNNKIKKKLEKGDFWHKKMINKDFYFWDASLQPRGLLGGLGPTVSIRKRAVPGASEGDWLLDPAAGKESCGIRKKSTDQP